MDYNQKNFPFNEWSKRYPESAGYTEPTTSKSAADTIEGSGRARTLREEVFRVLRLSTRLYGPACNGMTADEIAAEMGESVFSVRPRVAELHKQHLIEPTGERRKSSNGRASHVWRLVR
jgi:hypothetical protein